MALAGDAIDAVYNATWKSTPVAATCQTAVLAAVTVPATVFHQDADATYNPVFKASGKSAADSALSTKQQTLWKVEH